MVAAWHQSKGNDSCVLFAPKEPDIQRISQPHQDGQG